MNIFKKGTRSIKKAVDEIDVSVAVDASIRTRVKPKSIQGQLKKLIGGFKIGDDIVEKNVRKQIQKNANDLHEKGGQKYNEVLADTKRQLGSKVDENSKHFQETLNTNLNASKAKFIKKKNKELVKLSENDNIFNRISKRREEVKKGETDNIFIKHYGKGILGATMAGVGITAATTGKSFKEASGMVTDELRDTIIEPTVQVGADLATQAVIVGADSAAVVIEAGVKSSDNLIDATKEGIGGILGAFGFGDGFGLGSSFGTMGIFVFVFMVYYMMIKSTKTTSAGMDLMVH